ncbi:hypothetical protein SAMN05192562_11263 [Kosakonia arachidis]|uniref:Uncharacterized protein n=1 Tax=Kosakonia arachidis TaxID=551989 RepID=A0A1I7E8U2_9ENTR|nr:hypothetical protein SAMN05192562_11263 [Kosakonia arachidis]
MNNSGINNAIMTTQTLDGITGRQREYIQWLQKISTGKGKPEDILATEAVDLLPMKLRTPDIKGIFIILI